MAKKKVKKKTAKEVVSVVPMPQLIKRYKCSACGKEFDMTGIVEECPDCGNKISGVQRIG